MFIKQLRVLKPNLLLYIPLPLFFIVVMSANFFATQETNTNDFIQYSIKTIGRNGTFISVIFPLSFMFFCLWLWSAVVQKIPLKTLTTSRPKVDWKRIFFSFFLWGSVLALFTIIAYFANPEDFVWNFKPKKFAVFLVLAVVLIPLQTSFEEYLFRGHLMQGLGLAIGSKLIPLIVSSVLFGLLHSANPEVETIGYQMMIYYIGTGLFLGIITLMDEGLELALGFHAANNLIGALLVTSDWTVFQTHSLLKDISEPTAGFEMFFSVLVILPLLVLLFSKVYKWNNWKERLSGKC